MTRMILTAIMVTIMVGSGAYFWPARKTTHPVMRPTIGQSKQDMANIQRSEEMALTILVPQNIDEYETLITQYVQTGQGSDPVERMIFVEKQITVRKPVDDIFRASAEAAAGVITPGGGPPCAFVSYFKLKNKTAYVLLNIDLDGWTGLSVSVAKIHPIVERTLLKFPQIEKVVFDFAPKDSGGSINL